MRLSGIRLHPSHSAQPDCHDLSVSTGLNSLEVHEVDEAAEVKTKEELGQCHNSPLIHG